MKKRITTILLAVSVLLALPGTASADAYSLTSTGPNWRVSSSYEYWIEVCADASTGSSTWTVGQIPLHDRVRDAVAKWNNLSTNLRFSLSNSCVLGETRIFVHKNNYGGAVSEAEFDRTELWCEGPEPWNSCWQKADLKINTAYQWYNGTGTPPSYQLDLYGVFVHEFGHGLVAPDLSVAAGDCADGENLSESMCGDASYFYGTTKFRTLSASDIAAFNARYDY